MSLNTKSLLFSLITLFLLFATPLSAQQPGLSAKQFVEQQFAQVKKTQSFSPLVEHVDWEKAFQNSSEGFRSAFAFESPSEMKSQYHYLATSPKAFAQNIILYSANKLRQEGYPEEAIAQVGTKPPYTVEILSENYGKIVEELVAANHVIGREEQKGDTTHVGISFTFRENRSNFPLKLQKKNNRWYFIEVPLMDLDE